MYSYSELVVFLVLEDIVSLVRFFTYTLGYDHVDEAEEKAAMREKEEEILSVLGLSRQGE